MTATTFTARHGIDLTRITRDDGFAVAVAFEGRTYYSTGKTGTRIFDGGARVMEYRNTEGARADRRVWATADGTIYPDHWN